MMEDRPVSSMTSGAAAKGPHVLRSINRSVVLDALLARGEVMSVTDLVDSSELSRPAVTRALVDLDEIGLIQRTSAPPGGKVGRPAQTVGFRGDLGTLLGLSFDAFGVRARFTDLHGTVLASETAPIDRAAGVTEQVTALVGRWSAGMPRCWAATIGVPGVVADGSGLVTLSPGMSHLVGQPIVEAVADQLGSPVAIDNDMNLAALAERAVGSGRNRDDFAYVHWGRKIGAAIITSGRLHRGAKAAAGELGYLDLWPDYNRPAPSVATRRGAFGAILGAEQVHSSLLTAMQEQGASRWERELRATSPEQVGRVLVAMHTGDDPAAKSLSREVIQCFAAGLALFQTVLDLELMILGGCVVDHAPEIVALLADELTGRVLSRPDLVSTTLEDGVLDGAIAHARGMATGQLRDLCAAGVLPA